VERLDDTPQQIAALIDAWNQCLVAHGATYGIAPGVAGSQNLTNIPASAYSACRYKEPVLPPQLNPSQNPHYRNDMIAEVACLRSHGMSVHLTTDTSVYPDGLSWTFDANAGLQPVNQGQIQDECQLKAFGGKGK
jgi:hypothetical protein